MSFNWFRDTSDEDGKNWIHLCPSSGTLEVRRYHSGFCSACMLKVNTNMLVTEEERDRIEREIEQLGYLE